MVNHKHLLASIVAIAAVSTTVYAADIESGKKLFAQRCASCHGDSGAGDGPVAAALPADQKPRNLAQGQMKFATDDDKIMKLLKEGGSVVGLNALMPPQPDLKEDDLKSLVMFIKSLKK